MVNFPNTELELSVGLILTTFALYISFLLESKPKLTMDSRFASEIFRWIFSHFVRLTVKISEEAWPEPL